MTVRVDTVTWYTPICDDCGVTLKQRQTSISAQNSLKMHKDMDCAERAHKCSDCGKTLEACSKKLVKTGRSCCEECHETNTHSSTMEENVASLIRAGHDIKRTSE